ncbi:hypothetical protein [Methylorubrum extorquens]|uniref:Uncharacterized protein n=1 Tax=Methylorubrum extorquens (strain ATCC 14718 / DSM 1338 / JCM 2805 / NCIMB 9133 / AM1) TaxID=272630 RepID=C5B0R3_METEA|nr:hypothetical protein [Methylorubrum extorquens]ACS41650.1 Hypothetical protein MexAM1_META1p3968 [Methylorubrum extorquens AM1]MCP1545337.1 hypothetical protein [Methylorubrum extorquens]MCP1587316.1 hypothetical protein [Methylorubrum extorquens]
MTILALTSDYLAEFEAGYLTISRYSDGHCKAWKYTGVAGDFRESLKSHGADRTVATYLKIMRKAEWEPLYKPERMPGVDPAWDQETSAAEAISALPVYAIGAARQGAPHTAEAA